MSGGPEEMERVPLFGTWRNAYITVVVVFVLNVLAFYAFQLCFS